MADLELIELNKDMRIYYFDMENLYTNISKIDTTNIIYNIPGSNPEINMNIQKEILHIS
jgi:hypothetical protein